MPGPGEAVELRVVDGALRLSLEVPVGAVPRDPAPLDLASAPGATLDAQRAWDFGAGGRLDVACVRARADGALGWVEGLEGAVLDGASAMVRKVGGFATLHPEGPTHEGFAVHQGFHGRTAEGDSGAVVEGRHVLGFAGSPPELAVCTVACVEPAPLPTGAAGAGPAVRAAESSCAAVLEGLDARGFVEPPPPGTIGRAVAWSLGHPTSAAIAAGLVVVVAIAWLLRRRPRPAW